MPLPHSQQQSLSAMADESNGSAFTAKPKVTPALVKEIINYLTAIHQAIAGRNEVDTGLYEEECGNRMLPQHSPREQNWYSYEWLTGPDKPLIASETIRARVSVRSIIQDTLQLLREECVHLPAEADRARVIGRLMATEGMIRHYGARAEIAEISSSTF